MPRRYNCQLHQVALVGPTVSEDSLFWNMVSNHEQDVANWHFSADPKPVDMVCGSIAFPRAEAQLQAAVSSSGSTQPWVPANSASTALIERLPTTQPPPWRTSAVKVVLTPRWAVKGKGKSKKGERPLNIIERGPVREEYAAPWRHDFYVAALQKEMAKRAALWSDKETPTNPEHREEEIRDVLRAATKMWVSSLLETVWPDVVAHGTVYCVTRCPCELWPGQAAQCR